MASDRPLAQWGEARLQFIRAFIEASTARDIRRGPDFLQIAARRHVGGTELARSSISSRAHLNGQLKYLDMNKPSQSANFIQSPTLRFPLKLQTRWYILRTKLDLT
jgi:hypothetical protein